MSPPNLKQDDWEAIRAVGRRLRADQLDDFTAQGEGCGGAANPIRLRGAVIARTGDDRLRVFTTGCLPDGVFLKACGTRRETRCPACAAMYRGDARHLVRAGLVGGKGMNQSVAERPAVLLTLTAPSFGPVHSSGRQGPCHPGPPPARCSHGRTLSCSAHHDEGDAIVGSPLCVDCYDFAGAVLQNASTAELWRRTTIYVLRRLAGTLGWSQREIKERIRLSFLRVAEYQRRGVVHLHAVIRADGVDGEPPPLNPGDLAEAALSAARTVAVAHPLGVARWGSQLDVQVLDRSTGRQAQQVAGYVAKYATKSSDGGGALDAPLSRKRTWPAVGSLRICAAWSRWRGRSVATRSSSRSTSDATPTVSATAVTSCPSPVATPPASAPQKAARIAWREANRVDIDEPNDGDGDGDAERDRDGGGGVLLDRSLVRRWHAVGIGWANRGEALWAESQQRQRHEERRISNQEWYCRTDQDTQQDTVQRGTE